MKEIKKIKKAGLKQSVQNPEFKSFTALWSNENDSH